MTVKRGETWGERAQLPPTGVVARTDAEVRSVVEAARQAGHPVPPIGLLGGDLCRTLGGNGDERRLRSAEATTFPIDLGIALIDGEEHCFTAHLIARRSWWWGRALAVMNAEWLGRWDVAPRAHPGDGRLDRVDGHLSFPDRLKARRRLRTGTHIPHPAIEVRRISEWHVDLQPALDIWLDGEKVARARSLSVRVEPDAFTVVV